MFGFKSHYYVYGDIQNQIKDGVNNNLKQPHFHKVALTKFFESYPDIQCEGILGNRINLIGDFRSMLENKKTSYLGVRACLRMLVFRVQESFGKIESVEESLDDFLKGEMEGNYVAKLLNSKKEQMEKEVVKQGGDGNKTASYTPYERNMLEIKEDPVFPNCLNILRTSQRRL